MKKYIPEGGLFPKGYGFAYLAYDRNGAVCYPLPLNWIVAVARRYWINLRQGLQPTAFEKAMLAKTVEAYQQGRDYERSVQLVRLTDAREKAYENGRQAGIWEENKRINAEFDAYLAEKRAAV